MFLTSLKQTCNEYLIKFSENQGAPKLENRKTSPYSPCAPNLLHMLVSRIPGYHNLCSPDSGYNLDHDQEFVEKYEKNAQISRFVLLFKVFLNGRLDNRGSGEETSFNHIGTDFDCGLTFFKKKLHKYYWIFLAHPQYGQISVAI